MKAKPAKKLMLALACVALAACSRSQYQLGSALGEAQLAQLQEVQDLSGALARFGPPQRVAAIADGYVLAWEHWRIGEKSLGVSLGPLGVEAFSVDWGRAQLAGEFLLMRFDRAHSLSNYSFSRWDADGGGGSALQPSLGIVDVVDVDDLLTPMPQHRWGATWLQELSASLNSANSPDSGASALEQRGTPAGIGQRSLER